MQISMLLLFLLLYAHDVPGLITAPGLGGWQLAAVVFGVKIVLLAIYALACRSTLSKLTAGSTGAGRSTTRLDRLSRAMQLAIIGCFAADLYCGWLRQVRSAIGDWVLFDEIVSMMPALAMMAACWVMYYPIDRRMREAAMMRRIDEGKPVHPIWTQGQYLANQVRHQWALMGVPLVALWSLGEALSMHLPPEYRSWHTPLNLGGALLVFILTPTVIRFIWSTAPLPTGELRTRLLGMCKQHRVGVAELLLWRTHGGIINAAVMGVFAPLRYILMTDGLLEQLPAEQVEAVMAHEIAHVRKHHMFWLMAAAIGAMGLFELLGNAIIAQLPENMEVTIWTQAMPWAFGVAILGAWLLIFGYVSRRFERQADTFAVEHLTTREDTAATIDSLSAQTMIAALQQVAVLNHMSIHRRSWRHGSIAWRQRYLASLIGKKPGESNIHTHVMWIKVVSAVAVGIMIAAAI